jgi:hypothetical protein
MQNRKSSALYRRRAHSNVSVNAAESNSPKRMRSAVGEVVYAGPATSVGARKGSEPQPKCCPSSLEPALMRPPSTHNCAPTEPCVMSTTTQWLRCWLWSTRCAPHSASRHWNPDPLDLASPVQAEG